MIAYSKKNFNSFPVYFSLLEFLRHWRAVFKPKSCDLGRTLVWPRNRTALDFCIFGLTHFNLLLWNHIKTIVVYFNQLSDACAPKTSWNTSFAIFRPILFFSDKKEVRQLKNRFNSLKLVYTQKLAKYLRGYPNLPLWVLFKPKRGK